MNVGKTLGFVAAAGLVGGIVTYFLKQQSEADADLPTPHTVNTDKGHAKVAKTVEKTLHEHEGEDSPVVQAFQEAIQAEK